MVTNIKDISPAHYFAGLIVLLLLFSGTSLSFGQELGLVPVQTDCSIPDGVKAVKPGLKDEKIKVNVGFFLIDVKEINDVEQTYTADIFFNPTWNDPRLSEKILGRSLENCVINLTDVWHPPLIDVNRNKGEKLLPKIVSIDTEGNVNHKQRYIGELSSDLDFTNFPFDNQVLHFVLAAYGPDSDKIVFEQDKNLSGRRDHFSIEGWEIDLLDAVTTKEMIKREGTGGIKNIARIDFRLSADRDRNYYLLNVLAPLCLILLMASAVFWIPPTAIGPQIGLSTATVFTLIAYRFSLSYQLPRVSYFTRIDKFVLFSTILVFLALGAAIATTKIAADGNEELAKTIEKWARYVYLLAFVLILVFTLLL